MSAKRYRRKPIEVQAMHFTPATGLEVSHWCGGRFNEEPKASDHTDIYYSISIPTLEGVMTASVGDYVIRGVRGEFYPCKQDIFNEIYEEVT